MITLGTKHDILQKYVFTGTPKKVIAAELGLSKNTVKKYINEYEAKKEALLKSGNAINKDALIQLICEKPSYDTSKRKPRVVNDEVLEKIQLYLDQNEKYKQLGIRKQCMKAIDIHEALIDDGFELCYSTTNNYVNQLLEKTKEAFIKQAYDYGDVCEFDWGDVKLNINSKLKTFKMAVFTSAKGNYRFAYLYPKEATEFYLDAHVKFFKHVDGVYKTMVYDNMKVAVARFVGKTEKEATEALKNISLYYGFSYRFCNVRKGNEKGHVERSVDVVRRKAFSRNINFDTLEEANQHLIDKVSLHNTKRTLSTKKSPIDILTKEKEYLIPLLPDYETAIVKELRVDKYSVATIDCNKYSVVDSLVGKFVTAKIYTDKIDFIYRNKKIATHKRLFGLDEWSLYIDHYKNTLLKKPGALKGSLAFQSIEPKLQKIFTRYFQEAPKSFILLLDLISEYSLDEVLSSIDKLNKNQVHINLDNIKLILERNTSHDYYTKNIENVKDEIIETSRTNTNKYNDIFNIDTNNTMEVAI
jgi:predicted transcriptional regulator